MENSDFTELAGRIEGLARAYLVLTAQLHRSGVIDEQLLQALLRRLATDMPDDMAVAQRTLQELADAQLRDYLQLQGKTEADLEACLATARLPKGEA